MLAKQATALEAHYVFVAPKLHPVIDHDYRGDIDHSSKRLPCNGHYTDSQYHCTGFYLK